MRQANKKALVSGSKIKSFNQNLPNEPGLRVTQSAPSKDWPREAQKFRNSFKTRCGEGQSPEVQRQQNYARTGQGDTEHRSQERAQHPLPLSSRTSLRAEGTGRRGPPGLHPGPNAPSAPRLPPLPAKLRPPAPQGYLTLRAPLGSHVLPSHTPPGAARAPACPSFHVSHTVLRRPVPPPSLAGHPTQVGRMTPNRAQSALGPPSRGTTALEGRRPTLVPGGR